MSKYQDMSEGEIYIASRRLLEIAVAELSKSTDDGNIKLIIETFARLQDEVCKINEEIKNTGENKRLQYYDIDMYWLMSTAFWVCSNGTQADLADVHVYSRAGKRIQELICASLILKAADDLNTTIEFISEGDQNQGNGCVYSLLDSKTLDILDK